MAVSKMLVRGGIHKKRPQGGNACPEAIDAGLVRCWCGVTLFLCGLETDGRYEQLPFDQTQRRIFEQRRRLVEQVAFAQFFVFAVLAQKQEDLAITRLFGARRFGFSLLSFGYDWSFVCRFRRAVAGSITVINY